MRVKRLEVQGFKSFKDRTIIHFDQPITGIVGPNGCGKSNIVDAFFWVMGDLSNKHMRASGSEDLIFNGGAKYSPLGMAEATLVLETDLEPDLSHAPSGASTQDIPPPLKGKEVSVTRRVHRGGEGEYFINGIPARLRDIHELFMDTGIGSRGYSVIKQGEIDKVVNAKPEDRRLLIEEAAGIAKYKARKKESLRKIESAETNLSRIRDVLAEMERTLASLDRQAQKARKYREYRQELIEKETGWARKRLRLLQTEEKLLQEKREKADEFILKSRARSQSLSSDIEVFQTALVTQQKKSEGFQSEIQSLQSRKMQEEAALSLSRSRQRDIEGRIEALKTECEELRSWVKDENESLALKETAHQESQTLFHAHQAESEEKERNLTRFRTEVSRLRNELSTLQSLVMEEINHSTGLKTRLATIDAKIFATDETLISTEKKTQIALEYSADLEGKIGPLFNETEALRIKREEKHQSLQDRQAALKRCENEIYHSEEERNRSLKSLSKLRSKLESLRELDLAHEGIGDGPKSILNWAKENQKDSAFGMIADAMVVHPGFEGAIEGLLESRLEDLVSEDESQALKSLEELSKTKSGRATIRIESQTQAPISNQDFANDALSLFGGSPLLQSVEIHSDRKGASWLRSFLSSVYFVEKIDPVLALRQSGALPSSLSSLIWVSRDGFVLESDGTLRGGSLVSDQAGSLLGRKRLILDLEKEVQIAEVSFNELEAKCLTLKAEIELHKNERDLAETSVREIEIAFTRSSKDAEDHSKELKQAQGRYQELKNELENLKRTGEILLGEKESLQNEATSLEGMETKRQSEISELKSLLLGKDAELDAFEESAKNARMVTLELKEKTSSLKHDWDLSRSMIEERKRRISEIEDSLVHITRDRDSHSDGDGAIETKIQALVSELSDQTKFYSEVRDEIEKIQSMVRDAGESLKTIQSEIEAENTVLNESLIRRATLEADLQNLRTNMEEKYGPGILEAMPAPLSPESQGEMSDPVITAEMSEEEEKALRVEVDSLHDRIRRLGDINPSAVEEYEDYLKRHQALETEKQDLEKSIQNLHDAIDHINKTSEERFRKAFEAIDQRFRKLFPIIFGGGAASLELVQPEGVDDILEAGIDILASPPGKKVQNIALLSGGEKALTALSLVFAIFLVKPSPFCILDEVDAPLDDSNVGKFNTLLKEMSARTQFILITHNKKTMELNDSLYGVTMEEPGVSKMVSIRMA